MNIDINFFLDSTYLKTPVESGLSEEQIWKEIEKMTHEAIGNNFYLVMVRPEYVKSVKKMISGADVKVGTVIGFPEGTASVKSKLKEASEALKDGADELDFVINYKAFKNGELEKVREEFMSCTSLILKADKIIKWIIETAALADEEIKGICNYLSSWAKESFKEENWQRIFVKSSTGFYKTLDGSPNGANFHSIKIMLEYSNPLPVKASGGIRSYQDALKMIEMGVKRIGTSSAKAISEKI